MPTDGISSGGSSAIGARLVPTKKPSKPSTMQSPVMSMAESGSSGRDPRQRLAEWPQQGQAEPEPDQQQQRAENAIALDQDGHAREEQEHRGDAEEEIEPDQRGAVRSGPGTPSRRDRARPAARSRSRSGAGPSRSPVPLPEQRRGGIPPRRLAAHPGRGVTGVYAWRAHGYWLVSYWTLGSRLDHDSDRVPSSAHRLADWPYFDRTQPPTAVV